MGFTAKVFCSQKFKYSDDDVTYLTFAPDHNDEANKEWSKYTPGLNFQLTVKDSVAEDISAQQKFTVTFEGE